MSGREQLVPRDLVYPPDKSKDEIDEANNQEFKQSEDSAEYAALGYLKYAPAVTVETVNKDGASAGKLQEGDAIDAVNGTPVTDSEAVSGAAWRRPSRATRWCSTSAARTRRRASTTIKLGSAPDQQARLPRHRRRRRPVGAVHHRLQPGQHRRPVGGPDVQPGRHRQADHRRPERVEVRRGHRHHHRRRQGRLRSAASPTRSWPPTRPARPCSWSPPTTATRPSRRTRTASIWSRWRTSAARSTR